MAKTAVITGASGGIGAELANIFASNGYETVLVARSRAKMDKLAAEIAEKYKTKAHVLPLDLTEEGAARKLFDGVAQLGLKTDVLVNNAGFADFGGFLDCSFERADSMLVVNVRVVMELSHLFGSEMRANGGGRIMNIASIAAFQPGPYMAVYYATKAFVLSFSQALYKELEGSGVTVTAVCPGPTVTGFEKAANMEHSILFKNVKPNTAQFTASHAYAATMKGKAVCIPGFRNKFLVFSTRFGSQRALRNVACKVNTDK